jgi:hypothetical protein
MVGHLFRRRALFAGDGSANLFPERRGLSGNVDQAWKILNQNRAALGLNNSLRHPATQQPADCVQCGASHLRELLARKVDGLAALTTFRLHNQAQQDPGQRCGTRSVASS